MMYLLMAAVFLYAFLGCVLLYAFATAEADPNDKPSRERLEYLQAEAKRRGR